MSDRPPHPTPRPTPAFLNGGGEMGALIRACDFSRSSLGEPETWPLPLRTIVHLMLNTGHPMFIFWGTDGACLYNDAYRPSIGPERHPSCLGRPALEVWGEIWEVIGPQFDQVMSGGPATWHENQYLPITRNGRLEDVYWTYSYSPIADEQFATGVGGVLVTCTETTQAVLSEQRRAEQVARQHRLFEQAPGFICILTGPDHVFEFVNAAYMRLMGREDLVGKPVRLAVPEVEGQGFFEMLDQVYATGQRIVASDVPILLVRSPGAPQEERRLDFVYAPVIDDAGLITGIFVEGHDVTAAHIANVARGRNERHLELLIDELNHRVKNTLAIVQSLAHQTFRADEATPAARAAFDGRLIALASAHNLLTDRNWEFADLADLVRGSLAPLGVRDDRLLIEGSALKLSPKTAVTIAMAMHELGTNACKYGALSNQTGRVSVSWTAVDETKDCQKLALQWVESGGPAVNSPRRRGFGSRMIERALASELEGAVKLIFAADGVVCDIEARVPSPSVLEAVQPMSLRGQDGIMALAGD